MTNLEVQNNGFDINSYYLLMTLPTSICYWCECPVRICIIPLFDKYFILLGFYFLDKTVLHQNFNFQCLHWAYAVTTDVGESVRQSASQSMHPSELHVQKSRECTTVQSIACNHVQHWYTVLYDYILKCIDFKP